MSIPIRSMTTEILSSTGLAFHYPNTEHSIQFKDLAINQGNHTILLGDSGKGKTTLLHLLSGLSKPTEGKVYINQNDIYQLNDGELDRFRADNLGFIFQEAHLLRNLSVLENILLAQNLAKKSENKQEVIAVLEKLQIADKANSLPKELSRGQLQRAAIARAVINKPKLLLADEPTAALDDSNTKHVLELLLETADMYEATLLIATHDQRIKNDFSNTYKL